MLNITTEPQENCEVLMTVEVDEQQTDKLLKAAAQRISREVKIPGFRPGKAPYRVVVQRFGEEVIRNEALEDLGKSVFEQALKQAELEPYTQAALQDVAWDPLVMKVRVPVAPVVEPGDYRAMRMEVEPLEVSEEEVNAALAKLQDDYFTWNPVERPAQLGDLITLAATEQAGDEVLADNDNVEYELTEAGAESAGPDLVTPLIGLSAGDEKEFVVTYPETTNDPRYAGKEVTISVKVHSVKEKDLYPLDDEFAQTLGDFDTLEQLKEKLTEDVRQRKQREADNKLGQQALKQLIESAERIEWPKALEEDKIDQGLEEQDRRLQKRGLSLDTWLTMKKKTREELREELRPAVQEQLRRSLVISKLVELEDLSVAGHEVAGQVDRMSLLAGERGDEIREALTTPGSLRYIAGDLLTSKALQRLVQIVKGEAEEETETEIEIETEIETEEEAKAEIEEEIAAAVEPETEEEKELVGVDPGAEAAVDE